MAAEVAEQARKPLEAAGIAKADEDEAERQRRIEELARRISESVNLDGLDVLIDATAEQLERLVKDTSGRVLSQLGVTDRADLVDQVNERAVEMANDRAAELVGKRWVGDELIDNPNAELAITEETRESIRLAIRDGLDENLGLDEIVGNIEDAAGFSEERAELIARTEIGNANSDAALNAYRSARDDAGLRLKKIWLVDDEPCPVCEENGDAGPIDLDDDFPSGDDAPLAHPQCECALSVVVDDSTEQPEE